jgi:hypothetical protein
MDQGFNPRNYVDGMRVLARGGDYVAGHTAREIHDEMLRQGVFQASFNKQVFGFARRNNQIIGSADSKFVKAKKSFQNRLNEYFEKSFEAGQKLDDYSRSTATVANLKKGMSLEDAVKFANKAMINYNFIESPADKILQRMFTFYSFERRNIPAIAMNAIRNPQQYALLGRTLDNLSAGGVTREDIESMYSWEKADAVFMYEAVQGKRELVKLGFIPDTQITQTANLYVDQEKDEAVMKMIGRLDPSVNAVLRILTSKDMFTGQPFLNRLNPAVETFIPQGVLDRFFDKRVGKDGKTYYGHDSQYLINFLNEFATRPVKEIERLKTDGDWVKYLTGVQTKEFDKKSRLQRKSNKIFSGNEKLRQKAKKRIQTKTGKEGSIEIVYDPDKPKKRKIRF